MLSYSSKEPIAFAQTYFAMQTRKQELLEQRIELEYRLKARAKLTNSKIELSKNIEVNSNEMKIIKDSQFPKKLKSSNKEII